MKIIGAILFSVASMQCVASEPQVYVDRDSVKVNQYNYDRSGGTDGRVDYDFKKGCVKTEINKSISIPGIGGSFPLIQETFDTCKK